MYSHQYTTCQWSDWTDLFIADANFCMPQENSRFTLAFSSFQQYSSVDHCNLYFMLFVDYKIAAFAHLP